MGHPGGDLRVPRSAETLTPQGFPSVGDTGFEPVTPAVSRQCSAAELIARIVHVNAEATPGIEPGFRVLQTLA